MAGSPDWVDGDESISIVVLDKQAWRGGGTRMPTGGADSAGMLIVVGLVDAQVAGWL